MEKIRYIEIGGAKVKLVEKACQGGCGQTFWGLESATNICQGCATRSPEQREKIAQRKSEEAQKPKPVMNAKIFGSDRSSLTFGSAFESPKKDKEIAKKETAIFDTTTYSIEVDGQLVEGLRKSDYEIIKLFVDNPHPLNMNLLFNIYYNIAPVEQSDYPIDELKEKKNSLITKISRARKALEQKFGGGVWFGQKKGFWQLKGIPDPVGKVSNLTSIDEQRKAVPRARPDIDLVSKAVDALSDGILPTENKIKEEIEHKDREKEESEKWDRCIARAKKIKEMVKNNRLLLADIAIEACDIVWGGGAHWNNFSKQRTVTDFAKHIGLNAKTLHEWIKVKKYVVDKLKKGDYSNPKLWKVLRSVQEQVDKDTEMDIVQNLFQQELSGNTSGSRIKHVIKTTKKVKHFISKQDLGKIHQDDLHELKATCEDIVGVLRGNKK